jgi:hypothetical protein
MTLKSLTRQITHLYITISIIKLTKTLLNKVESYNIRAYSYGIVHSSWYKCHRDGFIFRNLLDPFDYEKKFPT